MAKRRRGRPKLPRDQIRSLQVMICVSPAEYRHIKKAAEAADLSMSALTRDLVLKGTGYRPAG